MLTKAMLMTAQPAGDEQLESCHDECDVKHAGESASPFRPASSHTNCVQAPEGFEHGGHSSQLGAVRVVCASEDSFMHCAVKHCATRKKDVKT